VRRPVTSHEEVDMDAELERFRQEVTRLQAGKVRSSVRYPEALRGFAVRYATEALKRGESRVKAAAQWGAFGWG